MANLRKISGITSKNGRNDAKRLNIRVVTVSNDDKPKNRGNVKESGFMKKNGLQIITRLILPIHLSRRFLKIPVG